MVAVVFATGSLSGALACDDTVAIRDHAAHDHATHDHGRHGPDSAGKASLQEDRASASEAVAELLGGEPSGSFGLLDCDGCPHMHAHCCASMAIPAGDYGLKRVYAASMRMLEASAPLPLGQHFYPLLRPPSASV
ncbi:hypothetical protein W911_00975 [Hyphomicrobium nitrativorans NL23]|uniref:Uncharacterized protein n=2 Tax=Hyphomicrobium TaxID=81 RepID=V5SIQ7_9HYPH|nr:hypothetical protein W911_00975 [Hyphomicrobium nitrativorans NL23]